MSEKERADLIKKLKPYWKKLGKIQDKFYNDIDKLESQMREETRIDDLEFFWCDNDIVGIGNHSRTVRLIQIEQLEEE